MKMRDLYGSKDTTIIRWVYIYHMESRIAKELGGAFMPILCFCGQIPVLQTRFPQKRRHEEDV